jgi:hypothetical protein
LVVVKRGLILLSIILSIVSTPLVHLQRRKLPSSTLRLSCGHNVEVLDCLLSLDSGRVQFVQGSIHDLALLRRELTKLMKIYLDIFAFAKELTK